MSFDDLLDSEAPQDSWAEAIRDLQARQIALVSLLTARGIFTEEEFNIDRAHWSRLLDEERTKRIDQRQEAAAELRRGAARQLYRRLAESEGAFAEVDIFRAITPDMQGQTGVLIVRVVDEIFADSSAADRHACFNQRLMGLRLQDEQLLPILLTPDEKAQSVASLQFDMMIELQGLKEIE